MRAPRFFTLPVAARTPLPLFGAAVAVQAVLALVLIVFRVSYSAGPEHGDMFVLDIPAAPRAPHEHDPDVRRGREPPPIRVPRTVVAPRPEELPDLAGASGDPALRAIVPESLSIGPPRGRLDATRLANMGPHFGDGRVWVRPFMMEGSTGPDRPLDMDSIVRRRLLAMADSLERNPTSDPNRLPSWTFTRDGRTYGLDSTGLHLGPITIPAMLLALVPLPQGNIDQARANARLAAMRADIMRAAARAQAEDDFRKAVQGIRERVDRERRERQERDRARPREIP